jgi:hypothetical protein
LVPEDRGRIGQNISFHLPQMAVSLAYHPHLLNYAILR